MNPSSTTVIAYTVLLVALLTTAFAQIAYKHYHVTGKRASLALAIGMFLLIPPATFVAVHYLGIGEVYVLTSLNYGFVAFLGWKCFGEPIGRHQVEGLALITLGCLVYSL